MLNADGMLGNRRSATGGRLRQLFAISLRRRNPLLTASGGVQSGESEMDLMTVMKKYLEMPGVGKRGEGNVAAH